MQIYLLDTNIFSDILKNSYGRAAQMHQRVTDDLQNQVILSVIVACELRDGAAKKGSLRLSQRIDALIAGTKFSSLGPGAVDTYAQLRADLERRGVVIGQNDMLIAAHALSLDATLVTDNVREFKRVKGLRVENWLRS